MRFLQQQCLRLQELDKKREQGERRREKGTPDAQQTDNRHALSDACWSQHVMSALVSVCQERERGRTHRRADTHTDTHMRRGNRAVIAPVNPLTLSNLDQISCTLADGWCSTRMRERERERCTEKGRKERGAGKKVNRPIGTHERERERE